MSMLLLSAMKKKGIVRNGLKVWLEGKDFTNSPPTSVLNDRSGNGNNAVVSGMAYTGASGSDGNGGIVFDGVDDNVVANLAMSQNRYTIQIKVKILTHTSWKGIVSLTDVTGTSRIATLYMDQNAGFLSFTTNVTINLGFNYTINTVMDITMVFDYDSKKVFVNGLQVASSGGTPYTLPVGKIYLGSGSAIEFSKNNCYSVKVYNRALTNAEIKQNYNASK